MDILVTLPAILLNQSTCERLDLYIPQENLYYIRIAKISNNKNCLMHRRGANMVSILNPECFKKQESHSPAISINR